MKSKLEQYKEILNEFMGRLAYLSPEEKERLDNAWQRVLNDQKSCYHGWDVVIIFTGTQEECRYCGMIKPNDSQ